MNVYPSFSRILSSLLARPLIWLSRLIWLCSILFIRLINPSSSFLSAAACSLLKRKNLLKLYKRKYWFTPDTFLSSLKKCTSSENYKKNPSRTLWFCPTIRNVPDNNIFSSGNNFVSHFFK